MACALPFVPLVVVWKVSAFGCFGHRSACSLLTRWPLQGASAGVCNRVCHVTVRLSRKPTAGSLINLQNS